jgi:hypothetical protein
VTLPLDPVVSPSAKRTRSRLSVGLEKNLSTYAVAAASAGVALLACAQPAEGKVVFTKTSILVPFNAGPIQFDINGDGQDDFGLSIRVTTGTCTFPQARVKHPDGRPPLGCPFNDRIKVVPAQPSNEIWQAGSSYGTNCAADLARGVPINRTRPFGPGTMAMYVDSGTSQGHQFCPWNATNDPTKPYLGVKFLDTGGRVHYGWVRVTVVGFFQATIDGYAYETVPNKPLRAGYTTGADSEANLVNPSPDLAPDAQEPVSLGRLAQGAAGLAAWRRQNQVAGQ